MRFWSLGQKKKMSPRSTVVSSECGHSRLKQMHQYAPVSQYIVAFLLYSIYAMGMLERLEEHDLGVKKVDCWCAALLYALDIVLLADSL